MAPFKALYGRGCRYCIRWFEVGETKMFGSNSVYQGMVKVKVILDWPKATQSRQKSYIDVK